MRSPSSSEGKRQGLSGFAVLSPTYGLKGQEAWRDCRVAALRAMTGTDPGVTTRCHSLAGWRTASAASCMDRAALTATSWPAVPRRLALAAHQCLAAC